VVRVVPDGSRACGINPSADGLAQFSRAISTRGLKPAATQGRPLRGRSCYLDFDVTLEGWRASPAGGRRNYGIIGVLAQAQPQSRRRQGVLIDLPYLWQAQGEEVLPGKRGEHLLGLLWNRTRSEYRLSLRLSLPRGQPGV